MSAQNIVGFASTTVLGSPSPASSPTVCVGCRERDRTIVELRRQLADAERRVVMARGQAESPEKGERQ